jgi:hypothetical protein
MRTFQNWCALNGVQPLPASPADVARFAYAIADLGIDRVFEEIQHIGRSHYVVDLADPCLSVPVTSALNAISGIHPPRSWSGPLKVRFMTLPYDIQCEISRRETEREQALRQAQSDRADAKQQLKELQDGKNPVAA